MLRIKVLWLIKILTLTNFTNISYLLSSDKPISEIRG